MLFFRFLEHPIKREQHITFEVDMLHIGDYDYGDLRQTWWLSFKKDYCLDD